MTASITSLTAQPGVTNAALQKDDLTPEQERKLRETAEKFEASFISQMLKHSGFAESLTSNGGKDVSAFSGFYLEQIATSISERGGFGLADTIYTQLKRFEAAAADKGNDSSVKL